LNPFEIDVRDALKHRGLRIIPQYGVSGYWIDFVIQHPEQPGRFVLAIECDGASYHSSESARDRDRLRQEQLERLGWHFHRIWSGDWFANKERAVERVMAAYENALKQPKRRPTQARSEKHSREEEEVSSPPKRVGRLPVPKGYTIDSYTHDELVKVVKWVQSDDIPRTKRELLADVMSALAFERRGTKIVGAIDAAIDDVRGGG
jgi:very-short-patch-repair endonuclease